MAWSSCVTRYHDGMVFHAAWFTDAPNTLPMQDVFTALGSGVHEQHLPHERWRRYAYVSTPVATNCVGAVMLLASACVSVAMDALTGRSEQHHGTDAIRRDR